MLYPPIYFGGKYLRRGMSPLFEIMICIHLTLQGSFYCSP